MSSVALLVQELLKCFVVPLPSSWNWVEAVCLIVIVDLTMETVFDAPYK